MERRVGLRVLMGLAVLVLVEAKPGTSVASAQQPAVATPLVFDGVTVVDVEQSKLVPAQRVVIAGTPSSV